MKKKKQLKMKEYTIREFSMTAHIYDASNRYENVMQSHLKVANEVSSSDFRKLLDYGCGTGAFLDYMSEIYPANEFLGIDITPEMINIANKRKKTNLNFLLGDYKIIDLPLESFDVITCIHSFHHLPDPLDFLKNVKQILVKGGRLVISENACSSKLSYWITNNIIIPYKNFSRESGDVHYYNKKDMQKLSKKVGLFMEKFEIEGKNMYCVLIKGFEN